MKAHLFFSQISHRNIAKALFCRDAPLLLMLSVIALSLLRIADRLDGIDWSEYDMPDSSGGIYEN